MFEPIHGSAFDIMGKGLANPVGTFWSCVMLLEHLGEHAAAQRLMQAIEQVTADPRCTRATWAARPPRAGDRRGVRLARAQTAEAQAEPVPA
jgi:tartrate dehydrogenase/decarboxylase/D-malate dehydrogenase